MKRYTFEFNGKLHPSAKPGEVATALANIFQVSIEDTLPLLDGRSSFRREGINQFTARSYQRQFAKIGALGEISEVRDQVAQQTDVRLENQPANAQPAALSQSANDSGDAPACPKCQSHEITPEQCQSCGLYFEKYRQAESLAAQVSGDTAEPQDSQHFALPEVTSADGESIRAAKWLSLSGLFLTIVFIADGYLNKVQALPGAGIDFGYWPFIIGHLLLLRACFLFAEVKGYSSKVGLLGLLSLAGLAILLLLPDRRQGASGVSLVTLAASVVCIAVSVNWLAGFGAKREAMEQISLAAKQLSLGRNEYPSSELDDAQAIYDREQQEMREFLEQSLAKLRTHKLRPNESSEVASAIFSALARYAVWRNYQTYLHFEKQQQLPEALERNAVKRDQRLFAGILHTQIDQESQPRLFEEKTHWVFGTNPELVNPFWNTFNNHLWSVFEQIRSAREQAIWQQRRAGTSPESLANDNINLKDLSLPKFPKTSIEVTDRTITYRAPVGPLAAEPLTLALYLEPFKRPFGKPGVLVRFVVISPGFPQKYLYGDFNALKNYSEFYLEK
ncbi:hypothetical protein ACNKU7_02040 [Microbulbifer sp. SA54]|uniref:hypothetical protein n=1 Tax=Microbulbifer sp. SA54 TaxID=3401577 RepID=UPI003AAE5C92